MSEKEFATPVTPEEVERVTEENARRLFEAGAALMLEEKDISTEKLKASVETLLFDEKAADALKTAVQAFAKPNAAADIYQDLQMLASKDVLTLLNKDKS